MVRKKGNWWTDLNIFCKIFIIVVIPLGLVAIVLIAGVNSYPIGGKIVEGKPDLKRICDAQIGCKVINTSATYPCEVGVSTSATDSNYVDLISWSGYKGCNSSTRGYVEIQKSFSNGVNKRITGMETCSCEMWFG